jgi:transcription elongation factor GreA
MIEIRKRLDDEIKALDYELKVELPKEIQRAREYGDLRENAEYKAAKERQTFLQARISQLQQRVAALSMANLEKLPKDKVGLGSSVKLRDLDSGEDVAYEIVTPEDADPPNGKISVSSPIGRSMLGKEEGEEFEVRTPGGIREFELTGLETMHDKLQGAAGD